MSQRFRVVLDDTEYVHSVSAMPGCQDVAVSHGLWRTRGPSGRGKEAIIARLALMERLGFSAFICTVNTANEKEKECLRYAECKCVFSFYDSRTGNAVEVWMKQLNPIDPEVL